MFLIFILASFTNITVSACSTSTCIGQETPYRTTVTALYPFDGNSNDLTGYATGTAYGTTLPSYTDRAYVIRAISLTSSSQQYVQIPNIDLSQKSFTIQVWLRPRSLSISNDYGIFSQCDSNSTCLSLSIRSLHITLSFDSMNTNNSLVGSTRIATTEWIHVTVVYDATLYQQQIYVNGKIDSLSYGIVNSYQGISSSSTTTIGRTTSLAYGTTYFDG